jgi:hypothetical protein
MTSDFHLHRNAFGQLVFTGADGNEHTGVEPSRAFPITAPDEGIALIGADGHELAWVSGLADLPQETRRLVEEELAGREFMPEIWRVLEVSGHATPCTWRVETDRGETEFVLKAEEDIRRLGMPSLMVVDKRGIQFLIRNPGALDETSRKILAHFL